MNGGREIILHQLDRLEKIIGVDDELRMNFLMDGMDLEGFIRRTRENPFGTLVEVGKLLELVKGVKK